MNIESKNGLYPLKRNFSVGTGTAFMDLRCRWYKIDMKINIIFFIISITEICVSVDTNVIKPLQQINNLKQCTSV
jgi:hypothetical protein